MSVLKWTSILLGHKDGHFQEDPVFQFFVLNCVSCCKNQDQGHICVKSVIDSPPKTLEDLKNDLENGRDICVKQMHYFSQSMRGSDAFWE